MCATKWRRPRPSAKLLALDFGHDRAVPALTHLAPMPTLETRCCDRLMTEADIAAVVAMERLACQHAVHAWSEDNYRSSLRAGYWMRVRQDLDTGQILAVCVAMDGVDEVHLLNIAVDVSQHGRGVARELLATLYARCRDRQAARVWLEVRPSNDRARALYQREGFVDIGRRKGYYPAPEGREDALVMRREIDLPDADAGGRHALV
jgi:ribosomal-protein-alanine N-acetyltransferase